MSNFRVVREGNTFDGFTYRIEDIYSGGLPDVEPFVMHGPHGVLCAGSIEGLRRRLREIAEALDAPVLAFTKPKLVEVEKPHG